MLQLRGVLWILAFIAAISGNFALGILLFVIGLFC